MAAKWNRKDVEGLTTETSAPEIAPEPAGPPGPIPGTVRIVNMKPGRLDITMPNGTNVGLAPWSKTGTGHISEPVPRRDVLKVAGELLRTRSIRLTEEVL